MKIDVLRRLQCEFCFVSTTVMLKVTFRIFKRSLLRKTLKQIVDLRDSLAYKVYRGGLIIHSISFCQECLHLHLHLIFIK